MERIPRQKKSLTVPLSAHRYTLVHRCKKISATCLCQRMLTSYHVMGRKFNSLVLSGLEPSSPSNRTEVGPVMAFVPGWRFIALNIIMTDLPMLASKKEAWEYFQVNASVVITTSGLLRVQFSPHCRPVFLPYQGNVFQLLFLVRCLTLHSSSFNLWRRVGMSNPFT